MKYIDFESWTVTWLHEVTWLSKISWRTILSAEAGPHHPRPYFTPQCKMWAKLEMILFLDAPDTDEQFDKYKYKYK